MTPQQFYDACVLKFVHAGCENPDWIDKTAATLLELRTKRFAEKQECDKWCGMSHCDTNGCSNRNRVPVPIAESGTLVTVHDFIPDPEPEPDPHQYRPWELYVRNHGGLFSEHTLGSIKSDPLAPKWIKKIIFHPKINYPDTDTCIQTWLDLANGKYPDAGYTPGVKTPLYEAFSWGETPHVKLFQKIDKIIYA